MEGLRDRSTRDSDSRPVRQHVHAGPMIPHDFEAEECVLGACMVSPAAVEWSVEWLTPGDFYKPSHAHAFAAICQLYKTGGFVDSQTVFSAVKAMGTDSAVSASDLMTWAANVPAIGSVKRYGQIIQRHSLARQAFLLVSDANERLLDPTTDPADLIDSLRAGLAGVDSPILLRDPGDISLGQLLDENADERTPWVVPGQLRTDTRCMFIGVEGGGRSVLLRQIGICPAYGVHPFTSRPAKLPAVNTLIVDLENPRKHVRDWSERLHNYCAEYASDEKGRDRCRVWLRPNGIDLRRRADRAEFEDILRRHQPALVCFGPLYKSFMQGSGERYDEAARQAQDVFDNLRTRYGFALVIEHHAPHGTRGDRELRPEGSSLWLRWGELRCKIGRAHV